ncbi:transmembrane protein 272 [Nelusetta ayraudi]|uniref:transmembrane protein 272 n=1 Tax=Nelusetta ayraudi TaxID=303726 RepID=UPI003F6F4AA2
MSGNRLIQRFENPPQPPTHVLVSSKVIVCALTIANIAIGAVYLHDCPRQRFIPIYLIVMGVFGMALTLLSYLPCARQNSDEPPNPLSPVCVIWNSLTSTFMFCWFIAGNVWIYSVYRPDFQKNLLNPDMYCNKNLYLYAFWTTTLVYILIAVALLGGCCMLVCLCFCSGADPDDDV